MELPETPQPDHEYTLDYTQEHGHLLEKSFIAEHPFNLFTSFPVSLCSTHHVCGPPRCCCEAQFHADCCTMPCVILNSDLLYQISDVVCVIERTQRTSDGLVARSWAPSAECPHVLEGYCVHL